jgi:hypothetical protein
MNTTSSRAHTIVTIHFDQIIKNNYRETKKMSVINLIDLAGREYFIRKKIPFFKKKILFKDRKEFQILTYFVID